MFTKWGLIKGAAEGSAPVGNPRGNSGIFNPRKRDFRYSEAKSACFNFSFVKVKIPYFCIKI